VRDAGAPLSKNDGNGNIPFAQLVVPLTQLTELPTAVGSPHAAVKDQQTATTTAQQFRK
jgi:hypothetical protein